MRKTASGTNWADEVEDEAEQKKAAALAPTKAKIAGLSADDARAALLAVASRTPQLHSAVASAIDAQLAKKPAPNGKPSPAAAASPAAAEAIAADAAVAAAVAAADGRAADAKEAAPADEDDGWGVVVNKRDKRKGGGLLLLRLVFDLVGPVRARGGLSHGCRRRKLESPVDELLRHRGRREKAGLRRNFAPPRGRMAGECG